MRNKTFNFAEYCEIDKYVRAHFQDLPASAFHVYHTGLPFLERTRSIGVGGRVVVPEDKWALASGVMAKTAGKALRKLGTLGLIEFVPGNSAKRICNTVRRKLIPQLQKTISPEALHATIPDHAERIAERLQRIPIVWKGEKITPEHNAKKTGRIYMSKPNLQGTPERERFPNLVAGTPGGWTLVSCDYKAAEPTVLFHLLRQHGFLKHDHKPEGVYQQLATIRGIERSIAKLDFLALVYSPWKHITIPTHWHIPQTHDLQAVVAAAEKYRQYLWEQGKPTATGRRHTVTLGGRKITANPRENMHRGKLLSWQVQGTVADIFTQALNATLDLHDRGALCFCLQLHDSIIVAMPGSESTCLADIMQKAAQGMGIEISTETEKQGACSHKVVNGVNLPV